MVAIATDDRLSLFVKTQMDRVRGLPYLAFVKHDVDFLIVARKAAHCTLQPPVLSNLRAIGIFSLSADELSTYAGQPRRAYVRYVVSVHFVARTRRQKKTHCRNGICALRQGPRSP